MESKKDTLASFKIRHFLKSKYFEIWNPNPKSISVGRNWKLSIIRKSRYFPYYRVSGAGQRKWIEDMDPGGKKTVTNYSNIPVA